MKQQGPTPGQQAAINETHKTLLVAAAAGSGKTWTLTERIIRTLLSPEEATELSELLIVTFTTAAAAELRERIAGALRGALEKDPTNARLSRQLLSISSANIYTIDAFCNEILRRNAAAVGLPPTYRVPDTAEVHLLAASVMETTIDGLFTGQLPDSGITAEAFAALADCLTDLRGEDALGETLLYLYRKTQTQEEGVQALRPLTDIYALPAEASPDEHPYLRALLHKVSEAAAEYLSQVTPLAERLSGTEREDIAYTELLTPLLALLRDLSEVKAYATARRLLSDYAWPRLPGLRAKSDTALAADRLYANLRNDCKHMRDTYFAYDENDLRALFPALREKTQTLVDALCVFDRLYRAEKRRLGLCEYADMERYAYECLWKDGKRTEIAEALRSQFKGVYIDEYQDVNRLQDRIFAAISTDTNRFMVGDIKQSIYGFRSADPEVFADMKRTFPLLCEENDSPQAAIYMSENFRCDRAIIDTANEIFDTVFGVLGSSIGYLPEDRLICAKAQEGMPVRASELLLVERSAEGDEEVADGNEEQIPLRSAEAEAHAVAQRIRTLLSTGTKNDGTPIEARDIAILFRAAKTNIPVFSQVLASYGIPCHITESCDFFLNADVLLTLCLLNAIDNPSKDIYLTGLLCSPLFGFTPDELVRIRRADKDGPLYRALCAYAEATADEKCRACLDTLSHYRAIAEGMPMDALLFRLYRETGLLSLATQHGGKDNLLLLYDYARTFERSSFRGLYAFISYVNRLIENHTSFERPSEGGSEQNAVRLMSVHASKGLEFPFVFLGGCASLFRNRDGMGHLLYAQNFGLAMRLRDKTQLSLVDNPVYAMIADRLYETMFEEELRILYVALTRAREQLFLSGCIGDSAAKFEQTVEERCPRFTPYGLRRLRSYMELVCATAHKTVLRTVIAPTDASQACAAVPSEAAVEKDVAAADPALLRTLSERFSYRYPHAQLCTLPEKLSVSFLSPAVLDGTEGEAPCLSLDELSSLPAPTPKDTPLPAFFTGRDKDDSAERGIATHMFLQFCDFSRFAKDGAEAELARLVGQRFLSEDAGALVRLPELERFRQSSLLSEILSAKKVYRELRFHTHLLAADFTADEHKKSALADAQLLVQGVMDCIFEDADGDLHLIDYKTDRVRRATEEERAAAREELRHKHRLQLTYYAKAVERIFGKKPSTIAIFSLALGETVKLT